MKDIPVNIEALEFTNILEQYWMLKVYRGEQDALTWLREHLRSEEGLKAIEQLVVNAIDQANDFVNNEEITDAYEERKQSKTKKEELN